MIRNWLRDSGAVLAGVGLMMLVVPFAFGVGGILVAAGIALLATWGLFSLVVFAYNGVARAARALGRRPRVPARLDRHRRA